MNTASAFDVIVIGAGSAGCAVVERLVNANVGSILVLEAGPGDAAPQVKVPMGLVYMMGRTARDWCYQSAPLAAANNRSIKIPRGRMVGGSGSINSMVWFRGQQADFDDWDAVGWGWRDVESSFIAVEDKIKPRTIPHPHPLSKSFATALNFGSQLSNDSAIANPEVEGTGLFRVNMRRGRRWSAADAFLRPAQKSGRVALVTDAHIDYITFNNDKANGVTLSDGRTFSARAGIVLSAGSIASPAILMRSGIGPGEHLQSHDIDTRVDSPAVGSNLHDHPASALFHQGRGSGYGLELRQLPSWAIAPFNYVLRRKGAFASNICEAGGFLKVLHQKKPDVQIHFLPFMVGFKGAPLVWGSGYLSDVNICRPYSRGRLRLKSADALEHPDIDLGLLNDERDLELLVAAFKRLRVLLKDAPLEPYRADEVYPTDLVRSDDDIRWYIRENCGTSYHPVGTAAMGTVVDSRLKVKGIDGLWVADASVMPTITSANTNAPSMMIGYHGGEMITQALNS